MMRKVLYILLFLLFSGMAWGQMDSIPFLKASLMVGEPSSIYPQTVFGHAFLRLQCPSAGLDNCFSMESGNYEGLRDICVGNYPNRLVVVVTEEYLKIFDKEGRIVTEYPLNLSQKEIQRLWKFLDEKSLSGDSPHHDFFHHGCSQELIRFVEENLDGKIVYGESPKAYKNTLYSLGTQTLPLHSWIRIPFTMLLCTDGTDRKLTDAEKTAVPYITPILLSDARIVAADGTSRPVLKIEENPVLYQPSIHRTDNFTYPLYVWFALVLIVVCIISLIGLKTRPVAKVLDIVLFVGYLLIAFILLYVNMVSTLPTTSGWNWNYLIYNPLPLLLWFYGKFRFLPWTCIYTCYAVWIILFLLVMYVIGGHYVLGQYLMALTFAVRCLFKSIEIKVLV